MHNLRCTIVVFLLSLFLMIACEKEKVVVQGGSFRYADTSYRIKKVKVEHEGYVEDDYVLTSCQTAGSRLRVTAGRTARART